MHGPQARNNEMVVDIKSVTSKLPRSVEAFWYTPASGDEEVRKAVAARQAFLRQYHLAEETAPPLLMLDALSEKKQRLLCKPL